MWQLLILLGFAFLASKGLNSDFSQQPHSRQRCCRANHSLWTGHMSSSVGLGVGAKWDAGWYRLHGLCLDGRL